MGNPLRPMLLLQKTKTNSFFPFSISFCRYSQISSQRKNNRCHLWRYLLLKVVAWFSVVELVAEGQPFSSDFFLKFHFRCQILLYWWRKSTAQSLNLLFSQLNPFWFCLFSGCLFYLPLFHLHHLEPEGRCLEQGLSFFSLPQKNFHHHRPELVSCDPVFVLVLHNPF